jgi:hypothetical protein
VAAPGFVVNKVVTNAWIKKLFDKVVAHAIKTQGATTARCSQRSMQIIPRLFKERGSGIVTGRLQWEAAVSEVVGITRETKGRGLMGGQNSHTGLPVEPFNVVAAEL